MAQDFHNSILLKLKEGAEGGQGSVPTQVENSLPQQQRKTVTLNAISLSEVNSVELAYSKRPQSPESYKIHEDKDVNGAAKCVDFVADKYKY